MEDNNKYLKYAVILLNYNTVNDAINAAQSIVRNAISDEYVICFVDGYSTASCQAEAFRLANIHNSCILELKNNVGYAKGNNAGVRFLLENHFIFQNLVIMNPDVEVKSHGMIDILLEELNNIGEDYCGIQPLVWTPHLSNEANRQICIRKVYSYFDCILDSFYPIRKLFINKYQEMVYYKERPYERLIDFEVPSGCFFIIKTDAFMKVGMFDERTFLYAEEIILGYKLKKEHYKFVLDPSWLVVHEGGKSTGSHHGTVASSFVAKEEIRSLEIYMRHYLNCGKVKILLVKFLFMFNYYAKKISALINFSAV